VSATAAQRATAARELRRDASESQAARKAKINKRKIQRWKKDPSFAARLHNSTRITLGHLPEPDAPAPSGDLLDGLLPSRAWISVANLEVLGSALHPLANAAITNNCDPDSGKNRKFTSGVAASVVFVELVETPERIAAVREALAIGELLDNEPAALVVPLTVAGLLHVQGNPEDLKFLISAASDFRAFLDVWQFTDQEQGQIRVLGEVLWPAQEEFKARKLGETTIACAYDAWVLRFRDQNARVHLFSRREDAARELLQAVKYGLERLPSWLQLPVSRSTAELYELRAGPDDRRVAKAYPADKETAVENSCTHGHVDEWARMADPRKVWQAIEPTMAGSCHMVTTGLGPTNFTSKHWRRCLAGDARHHPCFIGALARPDRTAAWLKSQRAGMDEQQFRQEYPSTWQDALSGGGDYVFRACDLDGCSMDFYPPGPAQPGHNYVKAWDIGRHQDAAVGLVLDVTKDVHDVVAYRRLRGVSYPEIQREIETMHKAYPGISVIEDNAAGEAVRENLDLPQHQVRGFRMTASSKARIIEQLKIAVQAWVIKWDAKALAQLDAEMRGYQLPDDNVEQDSVIALAIALEHAPHAHPGGRILAVITV